MRSYGNRIEPEEDPVRRERVFNGKSILITGGTGSFGRKCVQMILAKYKPKN